MLALKEYRVMYDFQKILQRSDFSSNLKMNACQEFGNTRGCHGDPMLP
jgi:hypothetical protein